MPPSEGHSRAPKAPRSRARRRAQELAQEQPAAQHAAEAQPTADAQTPAAGVPAAGAPAAGAPAAGVPEQKKSHGSESQTSDSHSGTASTVGRRPSGATIRPTSPARAESVALVDGAIRRVPAATSGSQELFDVEAFEDSPKETEKASGRSAQVESARTENAKDAAGEKPSAKHGEKTEKGADRAEKTGDGDASSERKTSADSPSAGDDSAETEPAEPAEQARPASRFGRWRVERERQRAAEIEKERERERREAQHERILKDPGLDGLRAEERPRKERTPLTRARKLLYTAIALALVAVLYVVLVFFSPLLATQTITVRGASLLETTQVEQKLEPLRGVPLTRIDEKRVRELIGQDNVLRSVQVESRPPHELVVTLKERAAIAIVKVGETYHTVDTDGVSLMESSSEPSTSVPLVRLNGDDPQHSDEFRTISTALSAMPAELLAQVKEASATSTSSITLTLRDNTTVQWGTAQESELKAKVLLSLRQAVAQRAQEEASSGAQAQKVTVYDVSAPRVPVTR
ncbi:cell division protein FtsQ/DivIB [uncultured Rothia sp.]|uniref:cell division protein FtsQ/DivIB n=1 Tax=uncultured Rothia sp. TaxID=316088 RepID=UPI0028D3751D|nr:cell division protein FtsQ/DivIB [uncultured Rothia sp.]